MKIVKQSKAGSFYESFCDLIFGTLVLFIVLVMALALRVQSSMDEMNESTKTLAAEVATMVSPNRFTGGSDRTLVYVAHVPVAGETHLVWLPNELVARWELVRIEGQNDPVLDLCRLIRTPGGLTMMPASEVVEMAGGLTHGFVDWDHTIMEWTSMGEAIHVARELLRKHGALSAAALKARLGGLRFDRSRPEVKGPSAEYWRWLRDGTKEGRRWRETTGRIQERLAEDRGTPARVRFTALGPDAVTVGACRLNARQFKDVLRSIKPGQGFYLEHRGADGKPAAPPPWVLTDLLGPLGFDTRIMLEEALELAGRPPRGGP
jgi:hypothetical protein